MCTALDNLCFCALCDSGSGVAKLGHTKARALVTRDCAPPVQALLKIISAKCTVVNHKSCAKSANRAAQYSYLYSQNTKVLYASLTSMYVCLT